MRIVAEIMLWLSLPVVALAAAVLVTAVATGNGEGIALGAAFLAGCVAEFLGAGAVLLLVHIEKHLAAIAEK